jgi:2-desacetyl-2-hydroxyethyl bacteriochlorophyllide A dehydrogenase
MLVLTVFLFCGDTWSEQMKAMVLHAAAMMSLEEVVCPSSSPDNILVRVTHSSLCGTDTKIYDGEIAVHYPLILGHEVVGELVEAIEDQDLQVGDRVIIDPMVSCGSCFHCRIGQSNLCPKGLLLGRDANGGFAEFISVPRNNVFRLPSAIDSQVAPLIQVATTCLHAQRLVPIGIGDSVLVMGLGVTGQLHVQLAKGQGANLVIGISRSAFKRQLARAHGADFTFESIQDAETNLPDVTNGRGVDLLIETTGQPQSFAAAVALTRVGGRVLLFGINTASQGVLPFYDLYFKELAIYNARAAKSEDFATTIDLVQRGVLQLSPLITHVVALPDLESGFRLMNSKLEDRLKVVVNHDLQGAEIRASI